MHSRSRCTLRCTRSIHTLACLLRSRRRLNAWKDELYELKCTRDLNNVRKGREGSPNKNRGKQTRPKEPQVVGSRRNGNARVGHRTPRSTRVGVRSNGTRATPISSNQAQTRPEWNTRRRNARVNGSDLYVARFTKDGMGSAKPCWRCLEWSRWAGVKRIFHWNADKNRFDVVKVNNERCEPYETHSDIRLFRGAVSFIVCSR